MLYKVKEKGGLRFKLIYGILLVAMVLLISQLVLVGAWQSDNGNGTFNNPPLYADYPDPSMIRVGNDFYLASSTFVNSPGLVILHSQDLVNWEIISHCISLLPSGGAYDMIGGTKYGNGCFAPGLAYNNGTFYVAVNLNGDGGTRIYRATNPAGPWTYSQLSGGYFDPCLIFDNGTPYLAWGGAWENSIKMIQLNSTLSGTVGSQRTILSYSNVEGNHLVKRGSYYYLFNAVPAQRLVCSRSTSLWGPYGETTTLCTAGKGGHQGGIVDLPDGSWWGYLHQDDGAPGRMTRICPITWQNNWPMFGRTGYIGTVESSYTKPITGKTIMVPAASDEFNSSTLGLQWAWNHNPDNSKWSFTGTALRLKATTGSNFWNARNSLTQKGQGLTSSGSIRIDCSAMQNGDIMGLGMLGDPRGYIAVTKDSSGKKIIMSEEDSTKGTVTGITATILYFRLEMNFSNKQAKFFWKDDSRDWQPLGTTITMGFDWQNGTFQGEQYAILCFNTGSSSGYMDVDWFRLNDQPGPGGSQTPTPTLTPTAVRTATPTPVRTPTPVPGTPTPTPVRTATPVVTMTPVPGTPTPTTGTGAIKVQFYNQSKTDPSNQLYLNIQLVNTGLSTVSLSNVKIRYWYTQDGTQVQTFWCDYSPVGSSNVTGTFVKMGTAKTGADTYVEIGFSSGAGSLNPGSSTQLQCRCAKNDWSNYTQSNDYSFNSSASGYVDWTKVTGYLSGVLAWGSEP
jgi:beta-xylosidase